MRPLIRSPRHRLTALLATAALLVATAAGAAETPTFSRDVMVAQPAGRAPSTEATGAAAGE